MRLGGQRMMGGVAAIAIVAGPTNYVTNGTFTGNDATGWSGLGSWGTITGDKLVINNSSGTNRAAIYTFPVAPANGLACTVSFVVSGFVANGGGINQAITVCSGASAAGPLITGNGTYSVPATAGAGTTLVITLRNGMSLTIDNVQVIG